MLLALCNNKIIGLFNPIAGVTQTKQVSEGIAWNMVTMLCKITA